MKCLWFAECSVLLNGSPWQYLQMESSGLDCSSRSTGGNFQKMMLAQHQTPNCFSIHTASKLLHHLSNNKSSYIRQCILCQTPEVSWQVTVVSQYHTTDVFKWRAGSVRVISWHYRWHVHSRQGDCLILGRHIAGVPWRNPTVDH